MNLPTITYLSDIYFESGAIKLLPDLLQKLCVKTPLIVADKGLTALGFVDRLGFDAPVFDDIETNPSEASVLSGLEKFRTNQCDGIVALGGGSPIDCAKGIGLLVHHEKPLSEYAFLNGGLTKISAKKPPLIAIPTTAGTGSEVGRAALITIEDGRKMAFLSPNLIPNAVICDPILTLELPGSLTAGTGMDAMSHCIETFCSPRFNPVADAIALDGLKRSYSNIRIAVHQGTDLNARREMMMAALEGGLTFQKGLGFIHSLSHPLGGLKGKRLHHGTLNAIFLPHVLLFNMDACPSKMDEIAAAVGCSKRTALPRVFKTLCEDIGIPTRLGELNVTISDLEPMAELALNDHCSRTNPHEITLIDCKRLYKEAL